MTKSDQIHLAAAPLTLEHASTQYMTEDMVAQYIASVTLYRSLYPQVAAAADACRTADAALSAAQAAARLA